MLKDDQTLPLFPLGVWWGEGGGSKATPIRAYNAPFQWRLMYVESMHE
jgi:hypothetical protein